MPASWKIYTYGKSTGSSIGGNIQTYYLQAGTSLMPNIKAPIAFLEQAEGATALEFARELAHFLQLHPDLQGLVIGRFPLENQMSESSLHLILDKYPILKQIPVIYDIDFGHTQPIFTFPLGATVSLSTSPLEIKIASE